MTLTDKMRGIASAPLDDNFKDKVANMLMETIRIHGTRLTNEFEFYFTKDFGYKCRFISNSNYGGSYVIDVPYAYEEKTAQIKDWMIGEGFEFIPSEFGNDNLSSAKYKITY